MGMVVIPTDEVIYFKIVKTTNQLLLMPNMSMHLNPSPSPGWFCGPECQRSAWPTHKLSCGRLDSKASKDRARAESAKLEPTSSEKTLDSKLRFLNFNGLVCWGNF